MYRSHVVVPPDGFTEEESVEFVLSLDASLVQRRRGGHGDDVLGCEGHDALLLVHGALLDDGEALVGGGHDGDHPRELGTRSQRQEPTRHLRVLRVGVVPCHRTEVVVVVVYSYRGTRRKKNKPLWANS